MRLTITEGTWMSLDVSPDGRTIVFDLLGELFTLPINGGTARQLTTGMGINRQPRYSPDGRRLVFVSDRGGSENVWIADQYGNNARQLSDLRGHDAIGAVTSPTWSPDGRSIVVSQRLGATRSGITVDARRLMWLLAAYDVATGEMRWVSDTVPGRARSTLSPTFGVKQRALYATVNFSTESSPVMLGQWRIARLDAATGRLFAEMGSAVGRVGMRPAVSPDGRRVVYGSSSGSAVGLRVRDLTTQKERWLVWETLDLPSGYEHGEGRDLLPGYAFTPDSKSLVAAYGGKIHRIDLGTRHSVIVPFVAEVERVLGPLTVHQRALPDMAVPTRAVLHPALSPDGRRVAFSVLNRIWIMELPQTGELPNKPRRLTTDSAGEFYPTWSPDGRWIAYTAWRDGEGGAVWRADVSTTDTRSPPKPERLTTDAALYWNPAVTADGRRVVAMRLDIPNDRSPIFPGVSFPPRPADPRIISVSSQGGEPRSVATLGLSHEATRAATLYDLVKPLYLTSDSGRIHVGLSSWGWDGTDHDMAFAIKSRDGIVHSKVEPRFIRGVLSPDRRRALVSIGNVLYEVRLSEGYGRENGRDTLDAGRAVGLHPGGYVAARRWGTALRPWISWSQDGHRAIFAQGGVLYVGDVPTEGWITWQRVPVPVKIAPDAPRGTLMLRGARVITMRDGEVIESADLVIRNNRIVAVGPSGQVPIPSYARTLDARGKTILPGYVDLHEHGLGREGIMRDQFWGSLLELAYGVTAARDPSPRDNEVFTFAERERTGEFIGPRLFTTGEPYLWPYPPIRTLEDAHAAVRRHVEDFRTETFKIYYDADNTDRLARQLLAVATRESGLNATVHINTLDHALAGMIDGLTGIEHNPRIKIYDDFAMLAAQSGVTYTNTYLDEVVRGLAYATHRYGSPLAYPKVLRFVPPSGREAACMGCTQDAFAPGYAPLELANVLSLLGNAPRIASLSGRVGIGAHGNIAGLGFHYEMWLHALGGMPNQAILRSATIVGAAAIGHAKDLGSLEPGKLADLQILDKNPLEDIHNTTSIRYVMKNGRLYQADDLTEIWPRHKTLPSIYLWEHGGPTDSAPSRRGTIAPDSRH